MIRHNFSAFPLHGRRVLGLLPEPDLVHHVGRGLAQRVDAVRPARLPRVPAEVVAEVLADAVPAAVAPLVAAAPPPAQPRPGLGAPPLPVHVVVREDEVSLGLGAARLHVSGDDGLVRVDGGALGEHAAVAGSLQRGGQRLERDLELPRLLPRPRLLAAGPRQRAAVLRVSARPLPLPVGASPGEGDAAVADAPGVTLGAAHLLPRTESRVGGRRGEEARPGGQLHRGGALHAGRRHGAALRVRVHVRHLLGHVARGPRREDGGAGRGGGWRLNIAAEARPAPVLGRSGGRGGGDGVRGGGLERRVAALRAAHHLLAHVTTIAWEV